MRAFRHKTYQRQPADATGCFHQQQACWVVVMTLLTMPSLTRSRVLAGAPARAMPKLVDVTGSGPPAQQAALAQQQSQLPPMAANVSSQTQPAAAAQQYKNTPPMVTSGTNEGMPAAVTSIMVGQPDAAAPNVTTSEVAAPANAAAPSNSPCDASSLLIQVTDESSSSGAGAEPPCDSSNDSSNDSSSAGDNDSDSNSNDSSSDYGSGSSSSSDYSVTAADDDGPPDESLPAIADDAPLLESPPELKVPADAAAQVSEAGVPDRCISAGSELFSSCATEIAMAQMHFNLTVDVIAPQNYTELLQERGVSREEVVEYLQEALAEPSAGCCEAACVFNNRQLCDCEPTVMQVVVRFAGADEAFYKLLVTQLAEGCGFELYLNDSAHNDCPEDPTAVAESNDPEQANTCGDRR